MKLTKDNIKRIVGNVGYFISDYPESFHREFDKFCYKNRDEIAEYLYKNQEDAEKWKGHHKFIGDRTEYESTFDAIKNIEIVERLKKQIEELKDIEPNALAEEFRRQLQEILEGKDES